jgi:hypothetical protein
MNPPDGHTVYWYKQDEHPDNRKTVEENRKIEHITYSKELEQNERHS